MTSGIVSHTMRNKYHFEERNHTAIMDDADSSEADRSHNLIDLKPNRYPILGITCALF